MKNPFRTFSGYTNHTSATIRETGKEKSHDPDFSLAMSLFEKVSDDYLSDLGIIVNSSIIQNIYEKLVRVFEHHEFSSNIIEDLGYTLCLESIKSPGDSIKVGLFLSALINTSRKNLFFLEIPSSDNLLHFLGYSLKDGKTLEIDGDVGDFLGCNLSGGSINVNGNVRDWAAMGMRDGRILVNGSCGRFACEWMRNGTFLVSGKIESKGKIVKGNIKEYYKPSKN